MNVADFLKIFADDVAMNGGKLPDKYAEVLKVKTIQPVVRMKVAHLCKIEEEQIINETVNRILYGSIR